QSVYFNQLKDLPKGAMPMLSIETDLTGAQLSKLEAIKVEKKVVDPSQIAIPSDYKKFEQ
ncbi:MAG TPA: hypothetical protein VF411_06110, partial [Bacteroidia bacterium]